MLLRLGASVTEAALSRCFENLSPFSRTFRRRFGVNPSKYPRTRLQDSKGCSRVLEIGSLTAESPYCLPRVYLFTQFVSQVLPPSLENACSDCAESSLIFQMENRTQTDLPLISSWS